MKPSSDAILESAVAELYEQPMLPAKLEPKKKQAKKSKEPAPESMTMRFYDPQMTQRFIALCRQKELPTTTTREGRKEIVRVTGFRNKTEYTNLTAIWATLSLSR